jgi:hypothetical protein
MRLPIAAALIGLLQIAPLVAQDPGPRVKQLGSRDAYGARIATAASRAMAFELDTPAHVVVLRVEPDGSIELVYPADSAKQVAAGRHAVEASQPGVLAPAAAVEKPREPVLRTADGLARQGTRWFPPAAGEEPPPPPMAYWLLVVSDVAMTADDVRDRLESMSRNFPTIQAEVEKVARELTRGRTRKWTGLYTAVDP